MRKLRNIITIGIALLLVQTAALNTIKGSLFVNDQLRIKEIIVDPHQAQFPP